MQSDNIALSFCGSGSHIILLYRTLDEWVGAYKSYFVHQNKQVKKVEKQLMVTL